LAINRREFIRRVVASSILAAVGVISVSEFVNRELASEQQQGVITLPPPTTTTSQQSQSASSQQSGSTTRQSTSTTRQSTSTQTSQSTSQGPPSGYVLVAALSDLSGKTSAYFNHPNGGLSMLLSLNGQWKAFSAICTHAGCTVNFTGSSVYCPCHAGYFSPSNGAVQGGPPPSPLPEYGVLVQNGNLYVTTGRIN
jgi:Rieske Fe-S protein